jgi:hypothetical protein
VLVVRRPSADPALAALRAGHPSVRWLDAGPEQNVPHMRAAAVGGAAGGMVALLEDDCVIAPGWCEAVLARQHAGHPVVGGAIEPDRYSRGLDWAIFYCEYARFMPPFEGQVAALPGNNVSYRRDLALQWLEAHAPNGLLDVAAHEDWRGQGIPLLADGRMRVRNVSRWTADTATGSAFHHGKAFGGLRFRRPGALPRRLLYAAGCPLLPLLQTARVAREVLRRPAPRGSLVRALPWIIVFHTSWAFGELLGYLFGPGRSAERWQ